MAYSVTGLQFQNVCLCTVHAQMTLKIIFMDVNETKLSGFNSPKQIHRKFPVAHTLWFAQFFILNSVCRFCKLWKTVIDFLVAWGKVNTLRNFCHKQHYTIRLILTLDIMSRMCLTLVAYCQNSVSSFFSLPQQIIIAASWQPLLDSS